MNRQHLKELKKILKKIPEDSEGFDMCYWGQPSEEAPCGTVRCAAGYFCSTPYAWRRGLKLIQVGGFSRRGVRRFKKRDPRKFKTVPCFRRKISYGALAEFFGISMAEARYIFDPYEYPVISLITPETVIKRVDEVALGSN